MKEMDLERFFKDNAPELTIADLHESSKLKKLIDKIQERSLELDKQ